MHDPLYTSSPCQYNHAKNVYVYNEIYTKEMCNNSQESTKEKSKELKRQGTWNQPDNDVNTISTWKQTWKTYTTTTIISFIVLSSTMVIQ